MPPHEELKIDDPLSKPWQLWRVDINGQQLELLAASNTRDDLRNVRRRLDWHYQIFLNGEPLSQTSSAS